MNNSIKFLGKKIVLNYGEGIEEIFEMMETPLYEIGTEWFDYEGERYFLKKEKNNYFYEII